MRLRQLFDPDTSTYTYLLADEATRKAAIIDPVREQKERDLQQVRHGDVLPLGELAIEVLETPGHTDYRGHTSSTIGEERTHNPRVADRTREQFVEIMHELNLPAPRHLQEAVPANRACGRVTQ